MQISVIVSVIGPDRPGLIDRLSSVIVRAGGNWEGSRMLRLAGQFAGMVQVAVDESALAGLESALVELEEAGLQSRLHRAEASKEAEGGGRLYELEVVGQDRPGIVSAISGALARLGVNVLELATDCGHAPWTGERIFKTAATLSAPESLEAAALLESVEAIAHDLMVDLKPADQ
ncbi:MAG: ACT domain-containing protein [Verrucomicrobiae bacterium]|nr:ACT domain-containing protein [Verrucomicrobiae bacterium]